MSKFVKNFSEFGNTINEANSGKYEDFVRSMLKKYNVESPNDLDTEKKKEFYKALDNGWTSELEKGKTKN